MKSNFEQKIYYVWFPGDMKEEDHEPVGIRYWSIRDAANENKAYHNPIDFKNHHGYSPWGLDEYIENCIQTHRHIRSNLTSALLSPYEYIRHWAELVAKENKND